jgi:thiol-disulfide isomerase/thioredoxin
MSKIIAPTLLMLLAVSLSAIADDATLLWHNGDSLSGKLLKADDKVLTWQSPMFTDPLQIELSYLAGVKYPASEAAKPEEGVFRILMRSGDFLNGRLTSMTDTTMSFESTRFGAFEVARDQVLSLQRTDNSGMIYSGPRGLNEWQVTKKPPNVNNGARFFAGDAVVQQAENAPLEVADKQIWSESPDGSITTMKADTAIFLPVNLPDKFEVEFEVQSSKPLNFLMAMGRDVKNSLRIETWVDVLVAAKGKSSFKTLKTVGENDLAVHLYLFVDRTTNTVSPTASTMQVFSDTGESLGQVRIDSMKSDATGITFRNGDFDLSIRRLRISHWDGKTPRIASGESSRIELIDGTVHFGKVQGFDVTAGDLVLLVEEQTLKVPMKDVASIAISGQTAGTTPERPRAWLNFNDGGFVSGSLISYAEGTAVVQTPYAKTPLQCSTTGLTNIGMNQHAVEASEKNEPNSMDADEASLRSRLQSRLELEQALAQIGQKNAAVADLEKALARLQTEIDGFQKALDEKAKATGNGLVAKYREPDRLFHEHGSLRGTLVVEGAADSPIQWTPYGGLNASTLQGVENARFVRATDVQHLSENPELLAAFPDVIYLQNNDVLPCRIEACTAEEIRFTSPLTEVRSFACDQIQAVELSAAGRIHQTGFTDEGWKGISSKLQKEDRQKLVFRGNTQYSHPEILTGDTVRFHIEWPKQSWANLNIAMFGNGKRNDENCTHVCFSLMPNQLQVMDKPVPANQMMMGGRMAGGPGGQANGGPVLVKDSEADIQLVVHDGTVIVSVNGQPAKTIKINPTSSGGRGIAFDSNLTAVGQVIVNGRVTQRANDGVTISKFEVDNLSGASIRQFIEEESRQAVLTIPRFRRDSPPTHVIIAPNGDLLRGRLLAVEGDLIEFESRLETLRFDRSRVGAIVWLDPPKKDDAKPADSEKTTKDAADAATIAAAESSTVAATNKPPTSDADGFAADNEEVEAMLQAQLADGFSITMKPLRLKDGRIEGSSALLGKCSFPANSVRELFTGDPKASQRLAAYDTWVTKMAREPDWDIPQADGGNSVAAAMIGKPAPDFELPLLDGTKFRLSDHKDKIVVLDFWATWCGPCVMALPDYIAATSKFDESKVMFVAVNLQESSDQIRTFLSDKQLTPHVALDRNSSVAPTFQVSGIPHTVIIGQGNIVEDVHVGYQPGSGELMQTTLQQMLDGTWKRAWKREADDQPPAE